MPSFELDIISHSGMKFGDQDRPASMKKSKEIKLRYIIVRSKA